MKLQTRILNSILGGWNFKTRMADILQYDATSNKWIEIGKMKKARMNHAVSLIPLAEAQKLCV